MKNNILKSIFVTILLLLGVSHTAWGETIYFKNTVKWSNVYVYFYNSKYWNDNGSGSQNIASGPNQMTKVDDTEDVYSYTFTGSYTIVAFTEASQQNYGNFHQTKAVYRADFNTSTPMYTPETTASSTYNGVPYYNNGTWSAYPSSSGGGGETGTCDCPPSTMLYVYCSNAAPYIYMWNDGGTKNNEWPGLVMSKVEGKEGWYQYNINGYSKMILNNGSDKQTGNLNVADYSTSKLWQWSPGANLPSAYSGDDCPCGSSTYTVTIATNDANYGSVSPTEVANVASGTSISASGNTLTIGSTNVTATPATQTDQYTYSFNKWTGIPNGNEVTENITVTANFARANRTYTITYNLNSGAWNGDAGASSYTYGTGLTLPTNIQRTGYTFGGWYTSENFSGNAVTSISDTQTGDITLYAKWTAANITTYTVVGSSSTVFGTANCENCPANDMVKQADGTYVLKKSNINLSANTREYYIVGNHDGKVWRYPASGTLQYENSTAGDYDITFTLDLSTNPVTVSCTMVKAVSSTNFYYYDGKGEWKDGACVEFTKKTEYAYATLTGYQQNNEFKIFDGNTKSAEDWWGSHSDDAHTVACAPHIDNSLGDITLGKAGDGDYANAKFSAASIATSTFYVILYYPNTNLNSTPNYKLCASTTLPGGIAPAQDWYVYGVGGELSWDKNGGKQMSLHGDGYYYYTCSGVSQFKIDGSTLTDDALGGTYISNSFPDAATANITLDDAGDTYHNINVTNATGKFEIRLYPAGKAGNETGKHIIIAHRNVIAAGEFWYFDEENTGWENTIADKWKFVDAGDYAYVLVPANDKSNKFKVFPCNPKNDDRVVANDGNIATGELAGDIALKNTDNEHHNIVIDAVPSDYYVILYYPNTSTNASDKYLVAATYDLPGVQKYAVSFGVVGNTGGTITAKSGSSTITSGQLVSRATFTATPAPGYAIAGWYSDAEGTQKIDAAGTNTTYSQAITATDNTVYVKFEKAYAIYYKFNDQNWNDDYYAYIFTNEVWHSENGVQPRSNRSEYGKMSKYNDSVYYYKFTKSADYTRFAFSWGDHNNDDYFCRIDAVYRSDFHKDMPVFIAEKGQSADTKNQTKYYNKGVWMRFNDTIPGYNLGLRNQTDNNGNLDKSYRFTAAEPGDYISTVDVALVAGKTYSFLVKNDKEYYFTPNSKITCTPSNFHFELFKSGNETEVVIKPTITGTYTFQLNLANGKVEIDVLYPTTQYRLVYVEKDGSTIKKFHPSHIIKSHPEATDEAPMFDTVSMHVRPKVFGPTQDTIPNPNTCEIWLQKFQTQGATMVWNTINTYDVNKQLKLTANGVYNFVIAQGASTTTLRSDLVHPYRGRYYIRTDASNGGWNNYKQLKNYCYYTEYSRVYRAFDYYYCHWTTTNTNIKYTIACDYSYCVSDTLAQEDHDPHSSFTDKNGKLLHDANIRFMWNSFDNTLDRAYLAGADNNIHLLSQSGIYNTDGTTLATSVKLEDQNNWVYRADVIATTNARIKLRVLPYNGANFYSWFRGAAGDFSEGNTDQLIGGKDGKKYRIRVIYDFKTDHLICAWIPDGQITEDETISADLMIIRENQGEAAQLTFNPSATKLSKVTTAFCVLTFTKAHLENTSLPEKTRKCYWVSFPFDVNLSDVFGCGTFGTDFTLQYYSGSSRAKYGCWSDSESYWYYITNPKAVLKKGRGYVVVIDYNKILREQFQHGNTSVSLYFPSANTEPMDISGTLTTVKVPEYKCTIEREQRYIYDSNWNLIGVPAWANIDKFGNPMVATDYEPTPSGQQFKVGFHYVRNAEDGTWTTDATDLLTFKSMYAYLVQWAGTINWQEKKYSGEVHPAQQALQARRYAPAAEGEEESTAPEQYTLRLTLNRGEKKLDHTYVRLQEGNVTTDFDLNYDMTKIINSGANIYSLVGTQQIQCAANVQPLQEEARTISIPLGVVADQDGLYTFSLPDGTEGMNVSIADSESGMAHNLALGDYQTALTKGTYEGRFALEIQPRQEVSTGCEQTDAAGKTLRKVLINGNLYILRDGKAYTATGNEL